MFSFSRSGIFCIYRGMRLDVSDTLIHQMRQNVHVQAQECWCHWDLHCSN